MRAGRLQTLGAGMLVLAATVAGTGLSAAQQTTAPPPDPGGAPPAGLPEDVPAPETAEQVQSQASSAATVTAEPQATQRKAVAKPAASKTVSVGDNFFSPQTITINVGDTVTWKNDGQALHNATADDNSFATGNFGPGQKRSETFTQAGDVPYYCTLHGKSVQSGTITVLASSSGGSGGGSGGGGANTSSGGTSEAAAVSSPGAAGSSSSLPATGFAALVLAAIGFALVGSGTAVKRIDERGPRKRRVRFFSY